MKRASLLGEEGVMVGFKKIFKPLAFVLLLTCFVWAPAQQEKDEEAARSQVTALFKIFKSRDWKGLYAISEFSPAVKKVMTDPDAFAVQFNKGLTENDPNNAFGKLFDGMTDIVAGQAIVEGNVAFVSTSCKVTIEGKALTFVGLARLLKVDSAWKWDLAFTDDTEKTTEVRLAQLLGKPNVSGG